jgi:signal transduction histidine kinase
VTSRPWWLAYLVLADLAVGEWIRAPGPVVALVAVGLLVVAGASLLRWGWLARTLALALIVQAAVLGMSEAALRSIQRDWSRVRESRITAAATGWEQDLAGARSVAERLAGLALRAATLDREASFNALARLVSREPMELGIAVLEPDGVPYAWAGRHRLAPEVEGDSLDFRATPYYAVLESRRHLASGRTVVVSALLAADSTVPDQGRSLARRFEDATEVGLMILPPGVAPDTSDVFDYVEPTTAGPRLLFSVQLSPPSQSVSFERTQRRASVRVILLAILVWGLGLVVARPGSPRYVLLLLPVAAALRVPLGEAVGLPVLFSPRLFFHPLLGPLSQAAGPLALASATLVVLGLVWLGRRRFTHWRFAPLAAVLLLGAPFLVSLLGRGIQVPSDGAGTGLWLVWQVTIFLMASAIITVAAGLLPAARPGRWRHWPPIAGAVVGVVAAVVGVVIWNARYGWPDWYPVLWAVALGLVIWPGRRSLTLLGLGVSVGSAAALMVWGAEVENRVRAARADLAALGERADPIAVPLLERFARQTALGAPPQTTSELFALWRTTALGRQGFPAALGLWGPGGELKAELRLDELDLPDSLVSRMVREFLPDEEEHIEALQRIPSVHYLALIRLAPTTTLSVGLGPRTALLPRARLGRLLEPARPSRDPYRLTLAPTFSLNPPESEVQPFHREGWVARGERTVGMGDGSRDVYAAVELGSPTGLVVRGALLVVIDLTVLFALAGFAGWLAGGSVGRPSWLPEARAFRSRIAMALGAFFVVPAAGFALINIVEIAQDGQSRRDLMIAQTLRDASPAATLPLTQGVPLDQALEGLAQRVDANLVLYQDGRLVASNGGPRRIALGLGDSREAGVFEDFGLLSPLIDPSVFHRIAIEGEPTAVTRGPSATLPTRIGVRSVRLPTGEAAMLASPQAIADPVITAQQLDLAYLMALAMVVGLLAALVGANLSARALSRPVADLRGAALAFGRGEPLPAPRGSTPTEFQPVFAALQKMVDDIRETQEAQERAARVLAWGEMANQIAHEIKNPLTPMRLGIQHLLRVQRDGRAPLGPTLEETSRRILGEIDRLDTIARAFSRFAAPREGEPAPEPVALGNVVREVAALYAIAPGAGQVRVEAEGEVPVLAHQDEVKEALINLLENARNASATTITVRVEGPVLRVADDGEGIPADRLPRIFEPRFSTTTSGSGLGLAIVKRLVEAWGASIEVSSDAGRGTEVVIRFRPAEGSGGGGS